MTWKVGDSVNIALRLQTVFGRGLSYASYAAFQADGWSLEALIAGSSVSVTVSAMVPDPATASNANFDGTHIITLTLPGPGAVVFKACNSKAQYLSAYDYLFQIPTSDDDALMAAINAGIGTLVAGGSVSTVDDINFVEGDSLQASFTIPAASLKVFDLSSKLIYSFGTLADVGGTAWTIAAQARYLTENGELPSTSVAFSFQAAVLDKANNLVGIGWQSAPAGAIIDDLLPSAPTVTVSGGAITGTTGGTGGHFYGTNVPTVSISGVGTGGALTPVISNGVITGYTVTSPGTGYTVAPTATLSVSSDGTVSSRRFAFDVQLVPPSGSSYSGCKLTVISGFINVLRQQTTTP